MKSRSIKEINQAAVLKPVQRCFVIFLMLLSPIYTGSAADRTPSDRKEPPARYFSSPPEAVNRINELLRNRDWTSLSEYYDLSESGVDRSELQSGRFFFRTERPEKADPAGFWRYRHPFAPGFAFHHEQATDDPNLIIVVVGIEIDQGGRMKQRVFTEFKMRKSPKGYRILPP